MVPVQLPMSMCMKGPWKLKPGYLLSFMPKMMLSCSKVLMFLQVDVDSLILNFEDNVVVLFDCVLSSSMSVVCLPTDFSLSFWPW